MGQGGAVCNFRCGARKGPTEKVTLKERPTGGEEAAVHLSGGRGFSLARGHKRWAGVPGTVRSTWEARAVSLGRGDSSRDESKVLSH